MIFLFIPVRHLSNCACCGWALVLSFLFCSASSAYAEPANAAKSLDVTIVQSEDSGLYAEFSNALHTTLANRGLNHIAIDFSKPIPNSGLVISVGMRAAAAVAASNAPSVLNVLIPKAGYEKLLHDFPRRSGSHEFSAIFLDQPAHRQAHLIAAILPDKHNVGLLYSTLPEELADFRKELNEHGLNLHEQRADPSLPLSEALQNILHSSDVLLALPDSAVYNSSTIRNILLATYRSDIPLIGFSSGYVKAGALCAVFSTPEQISTQTAEIVRQFANTHVLQTAQYPHEFEVMVNEQVARSLGVQVKSASVLHDIISVDDRREP